MKISKKKVTMTRLEMDQFIDKVEVKQRAQTTERVLMNVIRLLAEIASEREPR